MKTRQIRTEISEVEELRDFDLKGIMEFITLGYTLDNRTMKKDKKLNYDIPPFEVYETPSTLDTVYDALKKAIEKVLDSNMALSLSGGLDSRVIAGLISEIEPDFLAYTFSHNRFEPMIARKVASRLGLRHMTIKLPPFNFFSKNDLYDVAQESGGTFPLMTVHYRKFVDRTLRKEGIEKVLTGGGFGYIKGGTSGSEVYSHKSLVDSRLKHTFRIVPNYYRIIVRKSLMEYCRRFSYRKLFPYVLIRNNYQDQVLFLGNVQRVKRIHVLVDSDVLSAVCSLPHSRGSGKPYSIGSGKTMSQALLRRFYPELNNIPYAMSLLPPQLPTFIHRATYNAVLKLYVMMNLDTPCPLTSYSEYQFIKQNMKQFEPLLLKYPPPFFKLSQIRRTIRRLTPKGAKCLHRMLQYSILASLRV